MKLRKIDIYLKSLNGFYQYECSKKWAKTCKEAKNRFLKIHNYLSPEQVKASYSMSKKG